MTLAQAVERAKQRTAAGAPTISTPVIRGGDVYVTRRVPFSKSWPRGRSGKLVGRENRAARTNLKLDEMQVVEIREAYGDGGGVTMAWLAEYYGVAISTICQVIHRQRWQDVE